MALDVLMQGGIYLTIACLALASIVSIAIIIERATTFRRLRRETESLAASLHEKLKQSLFAEARELAGGSDTPIAALVRSGLDKVNGASPYRSEVIAKELAFQQQRLASRLSLLATIASNAPYVGLFGTVCGIMKAFRVIAEHQGMSASIVANGIAEALITTAFGLFVAIPAGIAYNYFVGKVNYFIIALDREMADIEVLMEKAVE